MAVIGIDPGKNGAIARLPMRGLVEVLDWTNGPDMAAQVRAWSIDPFEPISLVALEYVNAGGGGGPFRTSARTAFSFGWNWGWWQGVLDALELPWALVAPREWMKGVCVGKGKRGMQPHEVAARLFPGVQLYGPKGGLRDGRADALLIAWWARGQLGR